MKRTSLAFAAACIFSLVNGCVALAAGQVTYKQAQEILKTVRSNDELTLRLMIAQERGAGKAEIIKIIDDYARKTYGLEIEFVSGERAVKYTGYAEDGSFISKTLNAKNPGGFDVKQNKIFFREQELFDKAGALTFEGLRETLHEFDAQAIIRDTDYTMYSIPAVVDGPKEVKALTHVRDIQTLETITGNKIDVTDTGEFKVTRGGARSGLALEDAATDNVVKGEQAAASAERNTAAAGNVTKAEQAATAVDGDAAAAKAAAQTEQTAVAAAERSAGAVEDMTKAERAAAAEDRAAGVLYNIYKGDKLDAAHVLREAAAAEREISFLEVLNEIGVLVVVVDAGRDIGNGISGGNLILVGRGVAKYATAEIPGMDNVLNRLLSTKEERQKAREEKEKEQEKKKKVEKDKPPRVYRMEETYDGFFYYWTDGQISYRSKQGGKGFGPDPIFAGGVMLPKEPAKVASAENSGGSGSTGPSGGSGSGSGISGTLWGDGSGAGTDVNKLFKSKGGGDTERQSGISGRSPDAPSGSAAGSPVAAPAGGPSDISGTTPKGSDGKATGGPVAPASTPSGVSGTSPKGPDGSVPAANVAAPNTSSDVSAGSPPAATSAGAPANAQSAAATTTPIADTMQDTFTNSKGPLADSAAAKDVVDATKSVEDRAAPGQTKPDPDQNKQVEAAQNSDSANPKQADDKPAATASNNQKDVSPKDDKPDAAQGQGQTQPAPDPNKKADTAQDNDSSNPKQTDQKPAETANNDPKDASPKDDKADAGKDQPVQKEEASATSLAKDVFEKQLKDDALAQQALKDSANLSADATIPLKQTDAPAAPFKVAKADEEAYDANYWGNAEWAKRLWKLPDIPSPPRVQPEVAPVVPRVEARPNAGPSDTAPSFSASPWTAQSGISCSGCDNTTTWTRDVIINGKEVHQRVDSNTKPPDDYGLPNTTKSPQPNQRQPGQQAGQKTPGQQQPDQQAGQQKTPGQQQPGQQTGQQQQQPDKQAGQQKQKPGQQAGQQQQQPGQQAGQQQQKPGQQADQQQQKPGQQAGQQQQQSGQQAGQKQQQPGQQAGQQQQKPGQQAGQQQLGQQMVQQQQVGQLSSSGSQQLDPQQSGQASQIGLLKPSPQPSNQVAVANAQPSQASAASKTPSSQGSSTSPSQQPSVAPANTQQITLAPANSQPASQSSSPASATGTGTANTSTIPGANSVVRLKSASDSAGSFIRLTGAPTAPSPPGASTPPSPKIGLFLPDRRVRLGGADFGLRPTYQAPGAISPSAGSVVRLPSPLPSAPLPGVGPILRNGGVYIATVPSAAIGGAGNAASAAASRAASTAATNAASKAASNAAATAASNSAARAASNAAAGAAGRVASTAASNAASNAAGRAASNAASAAAGRAASNAASAAASRAASAAASRAASNAASQAAANAASRIRVPSDIRLKRDIVELGRLPNGLHLYRYRYLGDDVEYVGVMAQEVEKIDRAAVGRDANGYLSVDYGRLGLRFMTWEQRAASTNHSNY